MGTILLTTLIPTSIILLFGLIKISNQAGRIEAGVKGLYARVTRLEHQHDNRR